MKNRQGGFTIVELTIATAVFSVTLLVITAGILSFSKSYMKGVYQTRTQEATRTAMDELAQSLQFASTFDDNLTSDPNWKVYCVDNVRYSYRVGVRFNSADAANTHALVRSPLSDVEGASCLPQTGFTVGTDTELLGNNMRLTNLAVTESGTSYKVDLGIIYGENDVLTPDETQCARGAGSQFCALSTLSTTVQRRL